MLKFLSKRFREYCPKFNGKKIKTEFYVTRRFAWGFLSSGSNYTFVCPSGNRRRNFRTFSRLFLTFVKVEVYVSTDKFCGKNFISSEPDLEPKLSSSFPNKFEKVFETASYASRGRFWGKLFIVLENKNFFRLFFVFLAKTYQKTC